MSSISQEIQNEHGYEIRRLAMELKYLTREIVAGVQALPRAKPDPDVLANDIQLASVYICRIERFSKKLDSFSATWGSALSPDNKHLIAIVNVDTIILMAEVASVMEIMQDLALDYVLEATQDLQSNTRVEKLRELCSKFLPEGVMDSLKSMRSETVFHASHISRVSAPYPNTLQ
jgi:hypothetical protein